MSDTDKALVDMREVAAGAAGEAQPQPQQPPHDFVPEEPAGRIETLVDRIEPGTVSRWMFWGILGFLVILFVWAALAEVNKSVSATGRVISAAQLQVISSLEPGVIKDIFVQPGQKVVADQPLVELDPTESGANLGSSSSTTDALGMKVARLRAEIAGTSPVFPQPENADAARQIQVERALYASRQADLGSLVAAGRAQVSRSQQMVAQAEQQALARASAARSARSEADLVRPLVERGIEPRLSLVRAESAASSAAAEHEAALAAVASARAQVSEAQANLARGQQDWRAQAANELALAQADLGARSATLPALQARLERTVLRAPVAGTISRVLVTTKGSAVGSGSPVLELAPDDEALLIEARVRPQDISSVYVGQAGKVGITAFDQSIYGTLDGKVVTVSPDSILDQQSGEIYYVVRIRTEGTSIETKDKGTLKIGAGMIATVSLLGEKRTVLQYILSPLTRFGQRIFRE